MFSKKLHKINYLGLSVFIVLFFLIEFSFFEILIKSTQKTYKFELATFSSDAVVLNKIQQFSNDKSWLPQLDNSNFKVITNHIKLLTNNRLVLQRINLLQRAKLSILLIRPPGFYYHYHLRDTEDPPILS
jgi:hypothetical protein